MLPAEDRRYAKHCIREARSLLEEAYDILDSAGRWGMVDMLGGSWLSGVMKHSRIDEARTCLDEARPYLRSLRSLARHGLEVPGYGPGELATLADFLFDGFLADFFVQRKIRGLQREIEDTLRSLRAIERALRA